MNNYQKRKQRKVDLAVLADIVDRIVKLAKPQKIILFGSAARDQMHPNSDVDLLVVKSGRFNRGRLVEKIYMDMEGAGEPGISSSSPPKKSNNTPIPLGSSLLQR